MEALIELCDLIAQNPAQFADKLAWICGRCPQSESVLAGSRRVSRPHLNAVLAVARFLSKSAVVPDNRPYAVVLEFLRLIPSSFDVSFWPQSFNSDAVASFFMDFFDYLSKAAELSPDFAVEVAAFTRDNVVAAVSRSGDNSAISRAFLVAISQNFPAVLQSDGDTLVRYLLEQLALPVPLPPSPREQMQVNSETSSAQSSPLSANANHYHVSEISSPNEVSGSSSGVASRLVDDSASASSRASGAMNGGSMAGGYSNGGGVAALFRQQVASFEEESVESLEKQEIAYRLITHILDKVQIEDSKLLEQVRLLARKQVQSMPAFLKIRKRDWNEQGPTLKARINAKLSVYQAITRLKMKSLSSLDLDGKAVKKFWLETLVLFTEDRKSVV